MVSPTLCSANSSRAKEKVREREKMRVRIEIERRMKNGEKMRIERERERADGKKDSLRLFLSSCLLSSGKPDFHPFSCSCALVRSLVCEVCVQKNLEVGMYQNSSFLSIEGNKSSRKE